MTFVRAVLVLVLLAPGPVALGEGMALLVPAYFTPQSGHWTKLANAAGRVPLVAIANLFNGPGTDAVARAEYVIAFQAVRTAGGEVIGYVYTQYGKRPIQVVKEDMWRWHELYRLDGFFLDEMSNLATEELLDYYSALRDYARQLNPEYRLVGNPGVNTAEAFFVRNTADVFVIFEHHTGYASFSPAAWVRNYPPSRFGHLVYAIGELAQATNILDLAASRRAGLIYVTGDSGANPWDTLPTYWEQVVDHLAGLNRAAAERVPPRLTLTKETGPLLSLQAHGVVGRHVLERASPAGVGNWQPVHTNLTTTGTSVWQLLRLPSDQFFRSRHE